MLNPEQKKELKKHLNSEFKKCLSEIEKNQSYRWIIIKNKDKYLNLLNSSDYKEVELYYQSALLIIPKMFKGKKLLDFILVNRKYLEEFIKDIT